MQDSLTTVKLVPLGFG